MTKQKVITEEKEKPSVVGLIGRSVSGQFIKGHKHSLGNPSHTNTTINKRVRQLKKALIAAVTDEDMQKIVTILVNKAKEGDISAIKELFDRCLGRPLQQHEVDVEVKTYTMEEYDSIRAMLARRCVNSRMLNVQE